MADSERLSGTDTYYLYKEESTYGTPVAPDTHFGTETTLDVQKTRNTQKLYGVSDGSTGGQLMRTTLLGLYNARIRVDFNPINFSHLKLIQGAVSGSGTGASPFSYTHATKPASVTIGHMINNDTDSRRRFAGCLPVSYTLRATEGQAPTCSMEFITGTSPSASTTLDANASLMTGSEYNFDGCTLEAPDGTSVNNIIDSLTITISREAKLLFGLSETAGGYVYGRTTYQISVSFKYLDDTHWTNFHGQQTGLTALATYASLAVRFTNGATKYVDFVFSTVTADPHNDSDVLNEALGESVTYTANTLVVNERVTT